MTLKGKTALITGSTAGLGLAIAERLAREGCNIVMNGIEPAGAARATAEALAARHGVGVHYDGADIGNAEAVEAMVEGGVKAFGAIDIVINNAVTRVFGPIEETDPKAWEYGIDVNLNAAFNTIRCTMAGMKERNWGRIVNMSSIYGMIGTAGRANYVTSKTALIGLTRAVAMEAVDFDITCNAVCPGTARTTYGDRFIADAMESDGISEEEAARRFLKGKQPTGRFIKPENIAELTAFLCGPAGGDINGAVMPIDMAWSAS